MENPRYVFSPIPARNTFQLPSGARLALLVVLNVEYFHFDRPSSDLNWQGPIPDVDEYSRRDYGARVGIWRLMAIFRKHGIRITAALNSDVCRYYPEIIESGKEDAWEWIGHGTSNSVPLAELSEAEESKLISESLGTIEEVTGARPRGWLSPRVVETERTPDLLAEAGVEYVLDWSSDELPFSMSVRSGTLLSIPYTRELNDMPAIVRKNHTPREFHQMICDQADVLHEEGGRIMTLSLHPFVSGHPFRATWLDRALGHIMDKDHVWSATGAEITDWFLSNS